MRPTCIPHCRTWVGEGYRTAGTAVEVQIEKTQNTTHPHEHIGVINWVRSDSRTLVIFYIYDLVLLWFATSGHQQHKQPLLQRPWYTQKATVSFEDILRTLRQATWQERVFSDPALDAGTRKLLKPFVEWANALA